MTNEQVDASRLKMPIEFPVGMELTWQLDDWARHDWHLRIGMEELASLVATGMMNSRFDARYDNRSIALLMKEHRVSVTLSDLMTNQEIGLIEGVPTNTWRVKLKEGTYTIQGRPSKEGIWFLDSGEGLLAITHSKARTVFRVAPTFKLMKHDKTIDPRFIAVLSLHFALIKGSGWP